MIRNSIGMRYFLIGSLLLCTVSCAKREFVQDAEFKFINNTNFHITYNFGLDKYNLNPLETKVFREEQGARRNSDETTYYTPFKVTSFDVTIKFDGSKCLIISPNGSFGPLNIKNYNAEKISSRAYKFTYTFTEADYNRATACP